MRKMFSFLYGSILGGLVGAALGLLLAPSSGEELRDTMKVRADTMQAQVKNAAATRRAELEQQLTDLRTPRKS